MDDIRRQDMRLFVREAVDPMRVVITLAALLVCIGIGTSAASVGIMVVGIPFILLSLAAIAWSASERKRFRDKRMRSLWEGCADRLARLEEVLKKMRRDQIADLREMPNTIRGVAQSLYVALRRADMIAYEVQLSEGEIVHQPPTWKSNHNDPQSQELYRLADRNIAEYRAQYAGVMAGVQRTEAQSAVFMTTLDTLRMKIIGYRLVGNRPELATHDFLEALAEAKLQLDSIDSALEELDLGHYPKTISVVQPPPIPEEIRNQINQGR